MKKKFMVSLLTLGLLVGGTCTYAATQSPSFGGTFTYSRTSSYAKSYYRHNTKTHYASIRDCNTLASDSDYDVAPGDTAYASLTAYSSHDYQASCGLGDGIHYCIGAPF